MKRLRLATLWLSGCSGCHMSMLNLHGKLLECLSGCELVYSPLADFKQYPEAVDVALVEGSVAKTHDLAMIRNVRERTSFLVSLGDCAVTGNVPAMRNPHDKGEALMGAYGNSNGVAGTPELLEKVLPVHHVVKVDSFITGCPPSPETIEEHLARILLRYDK